MQIFFSQRVLVFYPRWGSLYVLAVLLCRTVNMRPITSQDKVSNKYGKLRKQLAYLYPNDSKFLKSLPISWQPQGDDKTAKTEPGQQKETMHLFFVEIKERKDNI